MIWTLFRVWRSSNLIFAWLWLAAEKHPSPSAQNEIHVLMVDIREGVLSEIVFRITWFQ